VKKYDGFQVRLTASRTLSTGTLLLTHPGTPFLVHLLSLLRPLPSITPSHPFHVYVSFSFSQSWKERSFNFHVVSILLICTIYVVIRLCPVVEWKLMYPLQLWYPARCFSIYFIKRLLVNILHRCLTYFPLIHGCKFGL